MTQIFPSISRKDEKHPLSPSAFPLNYSPSSHSTSKNRNNSTQSQMHRLNLGCHSGLDDGSSNRLSDGSSGSFDDRYRLVLLLRLRLLAAFCATLLLLGCWSSTLHI